MPFEPRNFNRRFETRCRKAGVRAITVHATRKTSATLLAALDVHPRVAMRILRHAQIEVTTMPSSIGSGGRPVSHPREGLEGGLVGIGESVEVLLGGAEAAVAETLLDDLEIGAAGEQP